MADTSIKRKAVMIYLMPATVTQLDYLKQETGAKSINSLIETIIDEYYKEFHPEEEVIPPPHPPPKVLEKKENPWTRQGTHLDSDRLTAPDHCPTCGKKLEVVEDENLGLGLCCQADNYFLPQKKLFA